MEYPLYSTTQLCILLIIISLIWGNVQAVDVIVNGSLHNVESY